MKIIADESLDYSIVENLRQHGFEIYSIMEQRGGISD
jgi:hypothetical protein